MLEIGSVIEGKYKILSEIGRGGMSVVYMALNERANKTWAVKEIRKDGKLNFEDVYQSLVVETDLLKKLDHPNLPSIVDIIDTDETFIIVMDYIEGNPLSSVLTEYGALPQEYVIEWAKQLCDVLGYLHTREPAIIYRDMKPANIMLKPDGNITLIDFGTAREYKDSNLSDTKYLGTVGYAAPEQFGNMGQSDPRTDIYSLGATLYHLVTGFNPSEPPYEILPIRQINPQLSNGLEKIILKCIQRNPEDRYQSAAELMYDLEHYEEIDDKFIKKQRNKLNFFKSLIILSILSIGLGVGFLIGANNESYASYYDLLYKANSTSDYNQKVEFIEQAIKIPNYTGKSDAYLQIMDVFKENDGIFTVEESKIIEKLVTINKDELMRDKENYVDVSFELGKMFWYYFDYGDNSDNQVNRSINSINWFNEVLNNTDEEYENRGMAEVYYNVGKFYRDITTNIAEANEKGKYAPFFKNMLTLIDKVALNNEESEIVRLELLELISTSLEQYSVKFKLDGITKDEQLNLSNKIKEITESINPLAEKTLEKKKNILNSIDKINTSIDIAYSNKEG